MKGALLPVLLLLMGCGERATDRDAPAFANMSVTLPQEIATYPAMPGVELVEANCGACHSAEMILAQPQLTRAQWQAQVKKMREVWMAPIAAEDEPAILAYLEALSAAKRP